MALTEHDILMFKALLLAWYHKTGRRVPPGFSVRAASIGDVFRGMIREFQHANRLVVNGELDSETQKLLHPVDPIEIKRAHAVAWYHWAATHNAGQVYSEGRPLLHMDDPWALPIYYDCSGLVIKGSQAAGFANPAGYSYASGVGNTQSFIDHLRHIPFSQLKQGDPIVFGGPMYLQHAVAVVSPHPTNPLVCSNGHQNRPGSPCPEIVPYAWEAAGKPGQPVYALSIV